MIASQIFCIVFIRWNCVCRVCDFREYRCAGSSSHTAYIVFTIMANDVKKAFFYAPATRPLYAELPADANAAGEEHTVGRLERSLCGTRDAALNWSLSCTQALELGIRNGASSLCSFWHAGRIISMAVPGDDFVSEGGLAGLRWVEAKLKDNFATKTEAMGAAEGLAKENQLLNRILA